MNERPSTFAPGMSHGSPTAFQSKIATVADPIWVSLFAFGREVVLIGANLVCNFLGKLSFLSVIWSIDRV